MVKFEKLGYDSRESSSICMHAINCACHHGIWKTSGLSWEMTVNMWGCVVSALVKRQNCSQPNGPSPISHIWCFVQGGCFVFCGHFYFVKWSNGTVQQVNWQETAVKWVCEKVLAKITPDIRLWYFELDSLECFWSFVSNFTMAGLYVRIIVMLLLCFNY